MEQKNIKKPSTALVAIVIVVIALVAVLLIFFLRNEPEPEPDVITVSSLQKIINVSELSTFTAIYNGIAEVYNETKTEDVDYYVSYEARVNAGIDFDKTTISVDNEEKTINVTLPEIYITDINVDISSLDFIFVNDKANTLTVTQQAFEACEDDVKSESSRKAAIMDLAKQNAVNILTALITPFVEQMDDAYTLTVN